MISILPFIELIIVIELLIFIALFMKCFTTLTAVRLFMIPVNNYIIFGNLRMPAGWKNHDNDSF